MSIEDKIKAAAKNAEGRLEAAAGELIGDNEMKASGQAKQVQAAAMDKVADLEDKAKGLIDGVMDAANNAIDNIQK